MNVGVVAPLHLGALHPFETVLLFLIAAGLTLVFGIMDFINLAHGAQYMVGAYLAASFTALTGDFFLGVALALPAALLFGLVLEMLIFRHLYGRSHLDQVLATFGLILILNEGVKIIWGAGPISVPVPDVLSGSMPLIGNLQYPIYRFAIIAAGLGTALGLYVLVNHTRTGMLLRAGASDRDGPRVGPAHHHTLDDRLPPVVVRGHLHRVGAGIGRFSLPNVRFSHLRRPFECCRSTPESHTIRRGSAMRARGLGPVGA